MAKKKTRKPTKAERKQAEEHRWYRRNFAGPGDGERKYTQVEFLDALNRRDRFLFRQRDQIRRLTAQRNVARFRYKHLEEHVWAEHGCDFFCANVTTIKPIETPIFSMLTKTKSPTVMHGWIADKLEPAPTTTTVQIIATTPEVQETLEELKPLYTARAYMERRKELDDMRALRTGLNVGDLVNWDEFGRLYRNLDAQYSLGNDIIADKTLGWWWRIPYGWWLRLKSIAKFNGYIWMKSTGPR